MKWELEAERLFNNPLENTEPYYYSSLFFENNKQTISICSQWAGYKDIEKHIEIRVPRPIDGELMKEELSKLGEPPMIINSRKEYSIYFFFGGHGLIKKGVFEELFGDKKDVGSFKVGHYGFIEVTDEDIKRSKKAPSKMRGRVMKRDDRRCRICGRRPDDYEDLELHVHHIKPYSEDGLTIEDNLITLCNTCHDGLEPHMDESLFEYLNEKERGIKRNYMEKVIEYQKKMRIALMK